MIQQGVNLHAAKSIKPYIYAAYKNLTLFANTAFIYTLWTCRLNRNVTESTFLRLLSLQAKTDGS